MKHTLLTLLALSIFFSACSSDDASKKTITVKRSDISQQNLAVKGMTCDGCAANLERSISKIEGVVSVDASYKDKSTIVEFDRTKTSLEAIMKNIEKKGYESKVKE